MSAAVMLWESATVVAIEGTPKHASGSLVKVGDRVDKIAIDTITGGIVEIDRAVANTYRFPVADPSRRRVPVEPAATPPALAVEVAVAPARPVRRR